MGSRFFDFKQCAWRRFHKLRYEANMKGTVAFSATWCVVAGYRNPLAICRFKLRWLAIAKGRCGGFDQYRLFPEVGRSKGNTFAGHRLWFES
jgi:hypothetical protein